MLFVFHVPDIYYLILIQEKKGNNWNVAFICISLVLNRKKYSRKLKIKTEIFCRKSFFGTFETFELADAKIMGNNINKSK